MKTFKNITRTITAFLIIAVSITGGALLMQGCKASQQVSAKTGAQLWAENCQRCHNTPPPTAFSHQQWETVGLHMQSRALLTDDERDKIVTFLKQSSN